MNNVTHIQTGTQTNTHPTWCTPEHCGLNEDMDMIHIRHLETATIMDTGNDGPQLFIRTLNTRADAHATSRDLNTFIRARREYETQEETTAA